MVGKPALGGKQTQEVAERFHGTSGKRTFSSSSKTPASNEAELLADVQAGCGEVGSLQAQHDEIGPD